MRHFFLLIVVVVLGYAAWTASDPHERRIALAFITKHGLRIAALVLIVCGLLAAAVNFSATPIF